MVFLGDTMFEREQNYGYIEAALTSRLQGKKVIFRNLAWSADTVLGESRASFDPPEKGFDRLKEQLQAIKPTVAFLGYGMAESFKGEKGLEKFRQDINTLMDTISDLSKPDQVRFILVTPLHHESLGGSLPTGDSHNQQLALYADAIREIAAQRKARLIDVFKAVAAYHKQPGQRAFTDNGIHPNPFGYWNLGFFFEQELGLYPGPPRIGLGADGRLRGGSAGIITSAVIKNNFSLHFNGRDQFLMPTLKPARFDEKVTEPGLLMQVVGLQAGQYTLKIDGQVAAVFSDKEWGAGQHVMHGPLMDQVEELRQTIIKKNELFFHRWRPQNQTYLFGFRKHEQGQNAKEIPMFDPLISEQEEKIFRLTELKTRLYDLVPAEP